MYPGRLVRFGESDAAVVAALQAALNEALVLHDAAALAVDPAKLVMNRAMVAAVKLFQARNVDAMGMPLKVDGKVGPRLGLHVRILRLLLHAASLHQLLCSFSCSQTLISDW